MYIEFEKETKQRIHLYDGYVNNPIWTQPDNRSTHYDYEIDRQCTIPIKSREEARKELGLE